MSENYESIKAKAFREKIENEICENSNEIKEINLSMKDIIDNL